VGTAVHDSNATMVNIIISEAKARRVNYAVGLCGQRKIRFTFDVETKTVPKSFY
jgi:hypothetical protein